MAITVYIPTVTYAVKANKLLSRKNIKSKLIKTVSGEDGCRYGLQIEEGELFDAIYELKGSAIPYRIENNDIS